jgi:hypothetical protein
VKIATQSTRSPPPPPPPPGTPATHTHTVRAAQACTRAHTRATPRTIFNVQPHHGVACYVHNLAVVHKVHAAPELRPDAKDVPDGAQCGEGNDATRCFQK